MTWKIGVVEDHLYVADFLETVLSTLPEGRAFRVVLKAKDTQSALELGARERPDIWILDLVLPDRHGLELAREILHLYPEARILVFSAYGDEANLLEALSLGIHGFLPKGKSSLQDIIKTLFQVAKGERSFPPLPSPPKSPLFPPPGSARPSGSGPRASPTRI